MTGSLAIIGLLVVFLACAAGRQAARRKGRTPAWGFFALIFPPILLVLELLPNRPQKRPVPSNLVLEWVGAFTVLLAVVVAAVELMQ
jgi:hypothetical protein